MIIWYFNSSVLLPQLGNIFQKLANIRPAQTNGSKLSNIRPGGQILESIGAAARVIRNINSSNIAQLGRTILDVSFLEIDNICIMTQVGINGEI